MRNMFGRSPRVAVFLVLLNCAGLVQAQKKVVAYVPNWVDLEALSQTIDYTKLSHINIAFENPVDDEGNLSFKPRNTILIDAARKHQVKVLISIGGGSAATNPTLKNRYFDLLTDAKRAAFVARLASYVSGHGFDGLDVDIEGPSINEDYGAFIKDLAAALKPQRKLLTSALSKGYGGSSVPDSVFEHFDFINIMAYDGAGHWAPNAPGQHSSYEFAVDCVSYWIERGLPKHKAILGVPFYGYGFGAAYRKGDYSYSKILAAYPGAERSDQAGDTIWYNGLPTIRAKAQYVVDKGLGGVMIWSLDYDVNDERSLLSAIDQVLSGKPVAETP